jgi:hypothetical protein
LLISTKIVSIKAVTPLLETLASPDELKKVPQNGDYLKVPLK